MKMRAIKSQIGCGEMKTSGIIGTCTTDTNPDAWYPTPFNGGRPAVMFRSLVPEIKRAIGICNDCPKKQECLEEGLKPINLAHGIWGGVLAGDRIAMADAMGIDSAVPPYNKGRPHGKAGTYIDDDHLLTSDEREYAVKFSANIKPYLEE